MLSQHVKEDGSSIIFVMVAVAILAISGYSLSRLMRNVMKWQNQRNTVMSQDALVRFFGEATDCGISTPLNVCQANPAVPAFLYRTGDVHNPIASKLDPGIKYGEWTVKLECPLGEDGYVLRLTRLADGGTLTSTAASKFLPDPLNQSIVKWSDDDSLLFPPGMVICSNTSTNDAVVRPVRSESAKNIAARDCSGGSSAITSDKLCNGDFYKDISFTQVFKSPPKVMVSINYACDTSFAPCTNGGTDLVHVDAINVTKTGFRMICNGSPPPSTTCSDPTLHCSALCNWVAIGN